MNRERKTLLREYGMIILGTLFLAVSTKNIFDPAGFVTGLNAVGMYTGNPAVMTYCVVSKKEIVAVRDIVEEINPKAFVIVSDVREVMGEGFTREKKQLQAAD